MRFRLLVAALALALGGVAQAATWTFIGNNDCTALGAATGLTTATVNCCTGVRTGYCEKRGTAMGTEFSRLVYAVAQTNVTYTAGGDSIPAAQMNKLGMREFVYAECGPTASSTTARNNLGVVLTRTSTTPKVQLFTVAAGAIAEMTGSVADTVVNCQVFGH